MTTVELLVQCWRPEPFGLATGVAASAAYRWLRRDGVAGRDVCFGLALLVFLLAVVSPIGTLADGYLFSAHMLQHILLLLIVPALAAGTRSGTACASARRRTSTILCDVSTLPPATGAGGSASTMLPLGVSSISGLRMPAVAGASSPSRQRRT